MHNELIDSIINNDYKSAGEIFEANLSESLIKKFEQLRQRISRKISLKEAIQNVRKVGRLKLYRLRIRKGKVQRRRKVSAVKGLTFRGNKLVRMKPKERLRRKLGARRGKIKARAKRATSLRKRRISNRKRRALGLRR